LDRAERSAIELQEPLEFTLTRLGLVSEREMADAFSEALDLPIVGSPDLSGDLPILSGLSPTFLRQFRVVVLDRQNASVVVAMANPLDDYAAEAIALFIGLPVQRNVATPTDIDAALDRHFANRVDHSATEETVT
jgi:general secretion pathway protein E